MLAAWLFLLPISHQDPNRIRKLKTESGSTELAFQESGSVHHGSSVLAAKAKLAVFTAAPPRFSIPDQATHMDAV